MKILFFRSLMLEELTYYKALEVMGSKNLGADVNLAWPTAQIAVMGAEAAVVMMQGKQLAAPEAPADVRCSPGGHEDAGGGGAALGACD